MIRYLEDDEKNKIIPLYEATFDDEEKYKEYFFQEILPDNFVAVCQEDEEIRGMIHLIPKSIRIGNAKESCLYIYGVATMEKYRNQGIMKMMLDSVLNDLYDSMECFTYLIPSSEMNALIYKKYGFGYVMDKKSIKEKEHRWKPTNSVIQRRAEKKDLGRLAIFAEDYMKKHYSVYIPKTKEYFKNLFSLMKVENGRLDLFFEGNIILGYRAGFEDEVVEEVVDESIHSISWLSNNQKPYVMARIVNASKLLELVGTEESGSVVLKLNDPIIKSNDGVFLWTYGNKNYKFEKTDNIPDVEVTVEELATHVFGYREHPKLPKMKNKKGLFINDYV